MATATIYRQKTLKPAAGRFGVYGGRYVPETLMAALEELEQAYEKAKRDPDSSSASTTCFAAMLDGQHLYSSRSD